MLTQEQIERYDRNGYIGVENVLSSEEIEELRKVTDDFVEKSRAFSESDEVFETLKDGLAKQSVTIDGQSTTNQTLVKSRRRFPRSSRHRHRRC